MSYAPPASERPRAASRTEEGKDPARQPVASSNQIASATSIAVISAICLVAALLIASLPWLRAYRQSGATVAIPLAALTPAAICAVLVLWRKAQAAETYAASFVGLLILLMVLAGGNPVMIAEGLYVGPTRLLSETLPFTNSSWLLVFPATTVWLFSAIVSELLARYRRTGWCLAVCLGFFVLGYALVSGAPGTDVWEAAALFGLLAAIALTQSGTLSSAVTASPNVTESSRRGDRRTDTMPTWYRPWERAAAGAAIAAILAILTSLLVPSLPGLQHRSQRLGRTADVRSASAGNPLATIEQMRDVDPTKRPTPMVKARVNGPSNGYFSLAAFDKYDGALWSFDRTYQPTGGAVPAPPAGNPYTSGPVVKQKYQVLKSPGSSLPFVPYLERPTQVDGLPFDADSTSGTIVPVNVPKAKNTYSISSRTPSTALGNLPPSPQGDQTQNGRDTALPIGASANLVGAFNYLRQITGEQPVPTVAFIQAVVGALTRQDTRINPVTGKGTPQLLGATSLAEVVSAVVDQHAATPEQFATFVAVIARAVGVPARVVTGYRTVPSPGGTLRPGTHTLNNREAWTWAEIPVQGKGWVVADATPAKLSTPNPNQAGANSGGGPSSSTTTVPQPPSITTPANGGAHKIAPPVNIHVPHRHSSLASLYAVLAVIGGALLLFVLVVLGGAALRAARRWSRRRGSVRNQTAGAWLDVIDTLTLAGAAPEQSAHSLTVAQTAWNRYGADVGRAVQYVGLLGDEAVCATSREPSQADADSAWKAAGEVRRGVASQTPRSRRFRALLPFAPRWTEPAPSVPSKVPPTDQEQNPPMADVSG